jgi:hypothetical protein
MVDTANFQFFPDGRPDYPNRNSSLSQLVGQSMRKKAVEKDQEAVKSLGIAPKKLKKMQKNYKRGQ